MNDNWSHGFFRSVLSEDNGSGSSTRLIMVMLVSFIIGVGTAFAFKVRGPLSIADYVQFMTSASTFITVTCAPLYLINKGANVLTNGQNATTTSMVTAQGTTTTTNSNT